MHKNKLFQSSLRIACLAAVVSVITGCLTETTAGCDDEPTTRTLIVRAYDNAGAELTSDDVTSVDLFYFDDERLLVGSEKVSIGKTIVLPDINGDELHVVAWGNINGSMNIDTGQTAAESRVSLKTATRATPRYNTAPDDIFYGSVTIDADDRTQSETAIRRKVGSITVTVKGLRAYAGSSDEDYSVVVGETCSSIGFDGAFSGERLAFQTRGEFIAEDSYYIKPTNIFPEEQVVVEIYNSDELIASVIGDSNGDPITIRQGELTNVLVNIRDTPNGGANLNVSVSLTDWGSEQVWKEF